MSTHFKTALKFTLVGYNAYNEKVEKYDEKIDLLIFATDETQALEMARAMAPRTHYHVTSILEVIDVYELKKTEIKE